MLSLKNILYATTKILKDNFTQDVFIEDNNTGGFENSCFYVQLVPISTTASTKSTNLRSMFISIKYLQQAGESIDKLLDISDRLEMVFGRTLKTNDRIITINETEIDILNDEVGRILDFRLIIDFSDGQYADYTEKEEYELMQEINTNIEGKVVGEATLQATSCVVGIAKADMAVLYL